jgi:glycosyltransferase involved in cell wall biosynthesis
VKDFEHNDHIFFVGKKERDMLPNYYSAADLFVFPSKTDTFGMVVVEAQACGLPALVSNEGGPQEIIKDGESGYILREISVDYWRRRMIDYMKLCQSDPEKVNQMSKRAVELIKKRGSWDKLIENLST